MGMMTFIIHIIIKITCLNIVPCSSLILRS